MDGKFFDNNLFAVAGDTGRRLEVQLLDSDNLVQNTTGISLRLNADVAGQATYAEATLVDATIGLYELDLPSGMLIAPGNWQFQWQIIGANGEKLHSFAFTGSIGSNLAEGGTEATNFYVNAEELKRMQEELIDGAYDSAIPEKTTFLTESTQLSANLFNTFVKDTAVVYNATTAKLEAYKDSNYPTNQHRLVILPIEPYKKYKINVFLHNRCRIGVSNAVSLVVPTNPSVLPLDRMILNESVPATPTITFTNDVRGKWLFIYVYSGAVPTTEPAVEVFDFIFKPTTEIKLDVETVQGLTTKSANLFTSEWLSQFGFDSSGVIYKDNPNARTAIKKIEQGKTYYLQLTGNNTSFNIATTTNVYRNPMVLTVLTNDKTIKTFSFTSAVNGWIMIFVGNVGENKPYVQMDTKPITELPTLYYHGIKQINQYDLEKLATELVKDSTFAHYSPNPDAANLSLTYSQFIAQFTAYKTSNPIYITSRTIMNDTSNTYPIYEFALTPKVVKQTIFLTAGIHGDEPESYWGLYNLVKVLCDEEYSHPIIRYLRNYVEIVMIPVVNPWGYTNKTRENSRGINCNRNFDVFWIQDEANHSEGTAPFSENETKAVKNVLEAYEGQFDFHLDFHTVPTKWGEIGLHAAYGFVTPTSILADTLTATQEYMIRFWNKQYGKNVATSYKDTATSDMKNYVQNIKTTPSATIEYVSCNFSTQLADKTEMTRSFEWYANVIGDVSELFK